ncbi:unnamed protein product, partial [Didymodactylos carnosus]
MCRFNRHFGITVSKYGLPGLCIRYNKRPQPDNYLNSFKDLTTMCYSKHYCNPLMAIPVTIGYFNKISDCIYNTKRIVKNCKNENVKNERYSSVIIENNQSFTDTISSPFVDRIKFQLPYSINFDLSLYESRTQSVNKKCSHTVQSTRFFNHIIKNDVLDHLTFILRSKNIFYCSVPKVATKTLLILFTYLHTEELITYITNNNSYIDNELIELDYSKRQTLFNLPFLQEMMTPNSSSIINNQTILDAN